MVQKYIEAEGINNRRVLSAMRTVPRHEFVTAQRRKQAYLDAALPIGYRQTISPPFIVAYMTQSIDPQLSDRVLEIGTGSGYQAAILSGLVKEVYSIEIVEPLGKAAERKLNKLGYDNVHTKVGDGYKGWPEHAPFDKIIVTCSPEKVPQPLVDQLKEGGTMIIPLGQRYQQYFYLFTKADGKLKKSKLINTLFVPMTGTSEDKREVQPDPLNPQIVNGGFEIDSNKDGKPDGWHYQRQLTLSDHPDQVKSGKVSACFENDEPGRIAHALQGLAIDGRKIRGVKLSMSAKSDKAAVGPKSYHQPALMIHFYDQSRKVIGEGVVGPINGTMDWQYMSKIIAVPSQAREAIIRVGLNNGTGLLCVDEISLEAIK